MNPRRSLNFQRSIHSQQPYCTRKTEKLSHVERSSSNYPDIAVEETNCPLISNFSPPSIHLPPLEWLLLTNAATDHLTNRLSLFFRFLPRTNPFLPRRVHHHQSSPRPRLSLEINFLPHGLNHATIDPSNPRE